MQKDIHYNMTAAVAKYANFPIDKAIQLAWANQFTDDCTEESKYSIRTQCDALSGKWWSREVQQYVIVPFHFLPGDNKENKWIVTADSTLSQNLINDAIQKQNIIAFGLALHAMQDTFSHQSFTGWQDNLNAKHAWDLSELLIPRVGHAEYRLDPDDLNEVWTRNGVQINNKERARSMAILTYCWMRKYLKANTCPEDLETFLDNIRPLWNINSYDKRKQWLMNWAGISLDYSDVEPTCEELDIFATAARNQLAKVMEFVA
jgi:hypothetical protein